MRGLAFLLKLQHGSPPPAVVFPGSLWSSNFIFVCSVHAAARSLTQTSTRSSSLPVSVWADSGLRAGMGKQEDSTLSAHAQKTKAAKCTFEYRDNFWKGQRNEIHFICDPFFKTGKNETRENMSLKHIEFQADGDSSKIK